MVEPWEEYPHVWATKAAFFSYLRGALRRAIWMRWVGKTELKNAMSYKPDASYKGKAKKLVKCSLTGEEVGVSAAEVDHIIGNASLRDWEDLLPFVKHLCAPKNNLQCVSKEAHKVKSYAEKQGISFSEAKIRKIVIEMGKLKMPALKAKMQELGIPISTKANMLKHYEEMLKNGN